MISAAACVAADVDWQIEGGFSGRYTEDAWTPVRVTVLNRGASRNGRIIIHTQRQYHSESVIYSVPVDLPQGALKSYRLIIPEPSHTLRVKLIAGNETSVQEAKGMSSTAPEDALVVVLSSTPGILGFLNGTPAPAHGSGRTDSMQPTTSGGSSAGAGEFAIAPSEWGKLPEVWLGWDGADVVVVADSELGEAGERELEALRLWVRLGGTLVLTGGARAPALADGPLGEMLPMDVSGTRSIASLAALERWGGSAIGRQAALIADGTLRDDAVVLLGSRQVPLIVRRSLGAGSVVMTSFDFTAEPVRYWDGQPEMWRRMVAAGLAASAPETEFLTEAPGQYYYGMDTGNIAAAAGHSEQAALPPLWLVVGFLVAYIVMLVPLNYWFVSRMQRRELAWLTTPAVILVFFGAAYGTGFALRGHQTLLNRVSVIQVTADQGLGRALGYAGIFSPSKMDYAMRLEGTAAAASSTGLSGTGDSFMVEFGPEPKVRDLPVNMWSTRVVEVPFAADIGDGISGHLEWDGGNLSATVRNNTGMRLESVAIVREGKMGTGETLASGQEAQMDMAGAIDLSTNTPPPDQTLGDRAIRRLFAQDSYYGSRTGRRDQRPWVVAVTDEPLLPVELIDRAARVKDASVIVARLPVQLSAGKTVFVPAWLVEGRIVDSTGGVREYDDYDGHHVTITSGSATWEFAMPLGPKGGTVQTLEINMVADYPGMPQGPPPGGTTVVAGSPVVEVRNARTGQWDAVALAGTHARVPNAAQYVTGDGTVQVRVSAPTSEARLRGVGLTGSVDTR